MNLEEVTFLISGGEIRPQITMATSATIFQLKNKIAERISVPVWRQNLSYDNIKLKDLSTPINRYNFGTFTELILEVDHHDERGIKIRVSSPAFDIRLWASKSGKVIQVKEKLSMLCAVDVRDMTLWHMNKKMMDDKPLYKYYVTNGSEILFTRTGFST